MSSVQSKILSQAPSELELQVAKTFIDLESSSPELKADLRPLQIKSIREVC
ncbi:BEM_HP_G0018370.mRNA.1.CDS.1 [Saccharomyces cerevisiae]|jgi:small subunit ribosomal protein S7e|nr:BEM_HP_G0018370.mRNA.1.CDS.1 [Saccharomyces cerevisiae]CAI6924749.1 BEM_HP_G0018370.mRNA.1.CDS.1 [Saccharomyces cerevisiae]